MERGFVEFIAVLKPCFETDLFNLWVNSWFPLYLSNESSFKTTKLEDKFMSHFNSANYQSVVIRLLKLGPFKIADVFVEVCISFVDKLKAELDADRIKDFNKIKNSRSRAKNGSNCAMFSKVFGALIPKYLSNDEPILKLTDGLVLLHAIGECLDYNPGKWSLNDLQSFFRNTCPAISPMELSRRFDINELFGRDLVENLFGLIQKCLIADINGVDSNLIS
jgi:hypothetical protein